MSLGDIEPSSPAELDQLDALVESWTAQLPDQGMGVAGVERITDQPRGWYVRMDGEEKNHFSVVFSLDQRTLRYESYFMPAPLENHAEVFAHLLVRNANLFGLSFVIGAEKAIYLQGQIDNRSVDEAALDRVLGSIWMATEQCFRPAMRMGFASQFKG